MITKDMNMGTLVPVFLFLTVQTMGGIWWAATLTSQFEVLTKTVAENQEVLTERIEKVDTERIEDRRRIYDRLVNTEKVIGEITANERASQVLLAGVKEDVQALRDELGANNALIRQLLATAVRAGDKVPP